MRPAARDPLAGSTPSRALPGADAMEFTPPRWSGGAAAWCFTALLAACATAPLPVPTAETPPAVPAPPRTPSTADELVAYLSRLRSLDEASLAAEAARQREFARQSLSEVNRLKVALALSAAAQSDESDIIALVEPLARESNVTDPDVHAMASFLHGVAIERRRLKEGAATAGIRSRDDRKAYEIQRQRADSLQERNAQLQQKLDALTSLEKSLSGRKGN